jgi:hypothetical protein
LNSKFYTRILFITYKRSIIAWSITSVVQPGVLSAG